MNSIKHRFTLDMHSTQSQISIPASLYDTARTLYINFTDGGNPYHISNGCTALLIISKPSGAKLYEWCAIKDNTNVIYPFSQNRTTASEEGICECEITLYSAPDEDGDIEQIASPRFSIVVSERAINRGDDEVLPEASIGFIDQTVKDELVRRQKELERQAAETARADAETARASAETDRANAESKRSAAETERASAESARKTAENARASAETARASAETQRIANEAERQRNAAEYKAQVDLVREEISTWQDEWGKISSFDKRLENVEAAVSPGLVTPTVDSTVAYSKTVPANVLPNAAVCEVGGMTYVKNGVLVDSKVTEVASVGTNLFDAEKRLAGVFNSAGDLQLVNGVYEFYKYKFKEETQYTISGYFKNDSSRGNVRLSVVYTDGTKDTEGLANNTTEYIYLTFTSAAGKTINYIGVYYGNGGNLYIKGGELMINEGTETKPYSPYFRETLPIPGDALDGWGQGVNAQYYNKIVLNPVEGVKKYVKRKSRKTITEVFDDTGTTYDNIKYYAVPKPSDAIDYDKYTTNILIAGYEITQGNWESSTNIGKVSGVANRERYWFGFLAGTTLDEAKVTLVGKEYSYALATPVETDVSHLFTDDNLIPVEAGGTITAVNEYEQAVPFTIEYTVKGA